MIKKLFSFIGVVLFCNVLIANNNFNFNDNTPPTIFNFRIEASEPNRVYFDSSEPVLGSDVSGFTVSNNSIEEITIKSNITTGHYFTVKNKFTFWDNNTIRYKGSSAIKDASNNSLIEFTLSYIKNKIPEPEATKDRYVTNSAIGGGDGLSESTAWTFKEAFSKASAGMTVWIKAGNYGSLNLKLTNDGTSSKPIKFIGYKKSKKDITSNYFDYGVTWDSSEMPTLTGKTSDSGVAIWLFGVNHIVFRNIQITNYQYGFRAGTKNVVNSNIIFDRFNGNIFGGYHQEFGCALSLQTNGVFNGVKTFVSNTKIRVLNSVFMRSTMHNLAIFGDGNNLYDNVKAYNDRTDAFIRTDYHISLNGDNNIIRNCYVENFNSTRSNVSTHGIGIRGQNRYKNTYNLIEKCKGVNVTEPFYIRNDGSDYNVIKDCEASNNANASNYRRNENTGVVWIWGGADYNIVERVTGSQTTFGIGFKDNQEEGSKNTEIGKNNIIRNSYFNQVKFAIYSSGSSNSLLKDNKIINCTFNDGLYIFKQYNTNVNNLEIINCSFSNFVDNIHVIPNKSGLSLNYSNFYNMRNNWMKNSGEGNISVDPKFENTSSNNFRLQTDSPLIDAGKNRKEVRSDYENTTRPQGTSTDIGAFEYHDNTTSFIDVNAGEDISICLGESVTLTATGTGDFLWSTGETSASIEVSPTETTDYKITVSNENSSESDEVRVNVGEEVTVSLGDDVSIDSGESVTLTATGTGNFLWSTGETTASIEVSPTENTTYSVTASGSCGDDVKDEITVNVITNNVNAGEDVSICSGESVTLTATGTGDFLWSTGETSASIEVSPTETTDYTVTVSNESYSRSDDVTVTIGEKAEVNLGDDFTICSAEEIVLTATGSGSFLWNTGETSASITVNPTETTTYSVTASGTCGDDVTDEINVNVIPDINLNVSDDITICVGESTTLTATSTGVFLWSTGETTASIEVSPKSTTSYIIRSTSEGGCEDTQEVIVTVEDKPTVSLGDDVIICAGETVTLVAEGTGDFLWSTGEVTSSISVSPNERTKYTVMAVSSCSNDVTDEIIVDVYSEVTLKVNDNVEICPNETVILTAEGNGDILWSTGETTSSISVNPAKTTKYQVTSTSPSSGCSIENEVEVVVNDLPSVSLGNDVSICEGEEITLTAEGTGAFLWSTGETTSSIAVIPNETTIYKVTASNLCSSGVTDEIKVTVESSIFADAGDSLIIEAGQSTLLTASGGNKFLWSTGETTASITVQPNATTTYQVEVSNEGSSCSSTDTVEVVVLSNAESDENAEFIINSGEEEITLCKGEEITLTTKGALNYLWNTKEITPSIKVSPEQTTTYYVSALINDVLETINVTIVVKDCNSNKSVELRVYPNPTQGIVNVHLPSQKTKVSLSITSLSGKLIYHKDIKADKNGVLTRINLLSFSKGVYLLRMYNNNFSETKKILII